MMNFSVSQGAGVKGPNRGVCSWVFFVHLDVSLKEMLKVADPVLKPEG